MNQSVDNLSQYLKNSSDCVFQPPSLMMDIERSLGRPKMERPDWPMPSGQSRITNFRGFTSCDETALRRQFHAAATNYSNRVGDEGNQSMYGTNYSLPSTNNHNSGQCEQTISQVECSGTMSDNNCHRFIAPEPITDNIAAENDFDMNNFIQELCQKE